MPMQKTGRTILLVAVIALVLVPILSIGRATFAQDPYQSFGPSSFSTFNSFSGPDTDNGDPNDNPPPDPENFRGLPSGYQIITSEDIPGGSSTTVVVAPQTSGDVTVYKVNPDGTVSQYTDVSVDSDGNLVISTAGESGPATYLVGY